MHSSIQIIHSTLRTLQAARLLSRPRLYLSNGPTEAINGRLEHLRGSALGFRNLTNYIARSLFEDRRIQTRLHPALVKSRSSWGSAKDATETGDQ